ncbi:junctional adhesion molecule C-like [Sinocyclocheilus rhinocerous]|uniref:junctional adhesion molecule C-like n=1 Tax=Sinocyclocheilus rhinocerous TaxID=307959 RepID=UPI0007B91E38|nr:PREDICTED: junctional adhesion molecule C-like [Sinocyclocheilus rhinocerous]
MAIGRQTLSLVLLSWLCKSTAFAVILRTTEKSVWTNEFESIELTCLIESISTNNPRIEWKKIKNGVPSYVYFQNKISGDLEHRALLREPANLLILNTSRSDTAQYRCEVAAIDDQKPFDEILVSLAVRGTVGIVFARFSKGNIKFRSVKKEDAGEYYCQARNEAGWSKCSPQTMEVYDLDIVGIFLKVLGGVAAFIFVIVGICQIQKSGYCSCKDHRETNYKVPQHDNRMDYASPDEGHFRHKSSFVI